MCIFLLALTAQGAVADAPQVDLVRIDGVTQPMSDYIGKGKWVVINVWSPTCPACVKELPTLEKFRARHRDDVIVLGITLDFPSFNYGKVDIIKDFMKSHPLDYPIFLADLDLTAAVIGNRLVAIPLIAIFHPDGRVLARWPGDIDIDEIEEFMRNYKEYAPDDELSVGFEKKNISSP
jgi:thiol-disulfide isomerase/thioredoxin